jgi:hypothetical protein
LQDLSQNDIVVGDQYLHRRTIPQATIPSSRFRVALSHKRSGIWIMERDCAQFSSPQHKHRAPPVQEFWTRPLQRNVT